MEKRYRLRLAAINADTGVEEATLHLWPDRPALTKEELDAVIEAEDQNFHSLSPADFVTSPR